MDKEKILARIKELEDQKAQTQVTFAALEGALQDSKYWLAKLEEDTDAQSISD